MAITLLSGGVPLNDLQEKVMLDSFVDAQAAEQWIIDALRNKGDNRASKLIEQWVPILLEDSSVTELPGNRAGLLNLIFNHPDYKSRAERDALAP